MLYLLLPRDRLSTVESGSEEHIEALLNGEEDEACHQRTQVINDIIHSCKWLGVHKSTHSVNLSVGG